MGEESKIEVITEPSGAALVDQFGNELGLSGNQISIDLQKYGPTLELTIGLDGYEPKLERLKVRQLKVSGRYPPKGAIALRATSWWVPLKLMLNRHKWAGILLTVGCLGGLLLARSRHSKARVLQARSEYLEGLRAKAKELDDELIGTVLGHYRLTEQLGTGGTAKVYRGVADEALLDAEESVAVKVLNQEAEHDREFQARFQREVTIWKQLNHPNIVQFIDWNQDDGLTYLVVELMEGATLRSRFDEGPYPPVEAVKILKPVFEAVHYAHTQGVAHRDLKPENVMLTNERCKVTDFGLARSGSEDKITRTGTWVGTPEYMSPEQIQGNGVDPRTDQYALGIMLYELVSGEPPFSGDDQVAIIFKQVSSSAASLCAARPDVSQEFSGVVARMMNKRPDARFQDLKSALEALETSCG